MDEKPLSARVLRALTEDAMIRMAALDASPLWDGVRRGHPHLHPEACACLTELMAAALLLQTRTLFQERLQLHLKGSGRAAAMVADAWPPLEDAAQEATIRGVLDTAPAPTEGPWIQPPGILQVMRSNRKGEPFVGRLPLVEGSVSAQVENYLQESEQVQASLTIWCDPGTGEAGGLMVEPLPKCPPARMQRLVDALEGLDVVPNWERDPEFLLRWINQGDGFDIVSDTEVVYRCRCSRTSLVETLRGFPEAQRIDLFKEGSPVEVRCDYCGKAYSLGREDVLPELP